MKNDLKRLLLDVELALSAVNNCVATDSIDAKTDDTSWKIDNTKLILELQKLSNTLFNNRDIDNCPLYKYRRKCP